MKKKKYRIISSRALPYRSNVWLWLCVLLIAEKVYELPWWVVVIVALSLTISAAYEFLQMMFSEPYDPFERGDIE
jgi:phosphatidylglycerophosphate synthase